MGRMKMRPILRLITGGTGTGKTSRCIELFRDRLVQSRSCGFGTPAYFILPNKEHAERVHSLLVRDGQLPGVVEHHVMSISDFIRFRTWTPGRPAAGHAERAALCAEALAAGGWTWMAKSAETPGMPGLLAAFLREMKGAGISRERFGETWRKHHGNDAGETRFKDLESFWGKYEALLAARGMLDGEDAVLNWVVESKKTPVPEADLVILDGFFSLTPIQTAFVAALGHSARETVVTLTLGEGDRGPLFEYPTRLRERLVKEGFVEERMDGGSRRARVPALVRLERDLFDAAPSSEKIPPQGIRIFETATRRQELDLAARDILAVVNAGELHFSDCMLIVRSASGYRPALEEVMGRLGIPFELHERKRLSEHPAIHLLLDWLSVWDESPEGACLRPGRWAAWIEGGGAGIVDAAAAIRTELAAALRSLPARVPSDSWEEHLSRLVLSSEARVLLQRERVSVERLGEVIPAADFKRIVNERLDVLATEDDRCFAIVRDQLERTALKLQMGIPGRAAARSLSETLEGGLYSAGSRQKNRVQVYDAVLALPKEYRAVYVLGLNRGEFPAEHRQSPLLSDEERAWFNAPEALLDLSSQRYRNEQFFFYMAVTRASERLVLSRHRLDAQGRECAPSPWLERVERLFSEPPARSERQTEDVLPEWDRLCVPSDLIKSFCREDSGSPEVRAAECRAAWDMLGSETRVRAGMNASSAQAQMRVDFWERSARLEDPASLDRWAGAGEAVLSATRAGVLNNCFFQFYAKYGLGLERGRRIPIAQIEEGEIWHRSLEKTYGRYIGKPGLPSEAEFVDALRREIESELAGTPFGSIRFYERQARETRLRQDAEAFARWEYADWKRRRVSPWGVEIGFGRTHPDKPPARFDAMHCDAGGQTMAFSGSMDRVDVDPKTRRALIVDYKTSGLPSFDDIKKGLAPQAALYTLAAERLGGWEPVGVEFVSIRGLERRAFVRDDRYDEVRAEKSQKTKRGIPAEEFKEILAGELLRLAGRWKELRSGTIAAKSLKCGYCEFGPVCRSRRSSEWRGR